MKIGDKVYTRDNKEAGKVKSLTNRECSMEGCKGHLVKVVWVDGTYTLPCSGSINAKGKNWKIA